ncbi:hypothetical protein INF30_13190 [Lachnospiraceae bacterium DSM 108991]|uniref:Bypass of forespore C C-terminal domain-containing protein n=1 Tax=Claveliimonas monacensis TaxID=2779351 RepID=A0ABR9RMK2_9FIRM|nr:hypothetical protein [Claveliimonas monacensis]MBE5064207.1 hypothetical protein [Claveliimonas monacensis]
MKRKRKEGSQGAGNSRSTAAMLLCVLLAVTAVAAGTLYAGEKSAKDDKAQAVSVQNEDVQTVNEGWQEAKYNPLREETDSGITKAVRKYYEERTAQSPFAEGYENLKTYTKRGKYKDTYLAFVRYDMKIKDIYTMAPGLEILYIEPDEETGELCVEEEMPDQETREASQLLASQEDAGQLMTEVQAAYDGAVASDAILAEALSDLEEASAGQQ